MTSEPSEIDLVALALKISKLGVSRPPMTMEQALEQVIATGPDDVREYARQVLAAIRSER